LNPTNHYNGSHPYFVEIYVIVFAFRRMTNVVLLLLLVVVVAGAGVVVVVVVVVAGVKQQ